MRLNSVGTRVETKMHVTEIDTTSASVARGRSGAPGPVSESGDAGRYAGTGSGVI
jgi:hypothetical protein